MHPHKQRVYDAHGPRVQVVEPKKEIEIVPETIIEKVKRVVKKVVKKK